MNQPPKKKTSSCLIGLLVGLGLLVFIGGILAALGVYGARRYLAAAKTVEAKVGVDSICRAAQSAYEGDFAGGGVDLGGAPKTKRLCGSATPVPGEVPAGRKYQSTSEDWGGSEQAGWKCLATDMSFSPQYFQYHYQAGSGYLAPDSAAFAGSDGFEAAAKGDLDGDRVHSLFAKAGSVSGGSVKLSAQLYIDNEME